MRRSGRLWSVALHASLLALASACSSCDKSEPVSGSAAQQVDLAPVPRPPAVLAELFVRDPAQAWRGVRGLVGSGAALLPATFPMLVTSLLGLPYAALGAIDETVPMVGAVVGQTNRNPEVVVGVHLRSGRELCAKLTTGADAAYVLRVLAPSGIQLLEHKGGKKANDPVLGVLGNYLLAAQSAAPLSYAGPFVARTLPMREMPKELLVLVAGAADLAGPISQRMRQTWAAYRTRLQVLDRENRERHAGRAPDFADPAAAILGVDSAVEAAAAILESSESARLIVEPLENLVLRVELAPKKQGAAADLVRDLPVGDLAPLLTLPKATGAAVLTRSTQAAREASAKQTLERISGLFGERLTLPDKSKLGEVLTNLAKGRGDFTMFGVLPAPELGLSMQSSVSDVRAFDKGVRGLFGLLEVRAFAEPIRQFMGVVRLKQDSTKLAGIDDVVERATIKIKPSQTSAVPRVGSPARPVEILWLVKDGVAYGALAAEARENLVGLLKATLPDTLAADGEVVAMTERAGAASFSLLVEPFRLGLLPRSSASSAPILFSLGSTRGERDKSGLEQSKPASKASEAKASLRIEIARAAFQAGLSHAFER